MTKHITLLRSFAVLVALASAAAAEAQVTAASYTGSADFGYASQPVANVAANDTVGGAPATLGATGNATLSKVGTWTTGLGLDPTTGAISTTKTLPVGSYTQTYQICQKSAPTTCAQGNVSVTVINAVIVANPVSGTADFGIGSQPIANVTATDTINGAPVVKSVWRLGERVS